MKKTIKYASIVIVFIIAVISIGYIYKVYTYKIYEDKIIKNALNESRKRYTQKIKEREIRFNKNPNLIDAGQLMYMYMDSGYKEFEDMDKALYYAKKCVDLGVNGTKMGSYVNYTIAYIYKKKNMYDLSVKHLKKTIELNKDCTVKFDYEKDGMMDVYNKMEQGKAVNAPCSAQSI